MKRGFALCVIAVLSLAAFIHALAPAATDEAPQPGTLITVAGTGTNDFSGDGGPATQATLSAPRGISMDAAGVLYIVDHGNGRVRKVSADGTIATVAGVGEEGFAGDGGPATEAHLFGPNSSVVDGSGNLYIADLFNHRVRKVSPEGIITTVAGNGDEGTSGDGSPATKAMLGTPVGTAVDAAGNLYIADHGEGRVRKVSPEGIITTVAGGGEPADGVGDGGPATAAQLSGPTGLALDTAGNLYIAEYGLLHTTVFGQRVRKVSPDGIITTVAGTGKPGFSGDGGKASEAMVKRPFFVAVDTAGNLYIADWANYRVRKVSPEGIITTVAGSDKQKFSGEGGPATEAGLRGPSGVVVDAAGNLFIADSGFRKGDGLGFGERILKVFGVAAPGLMAGKPFPAPSSP
jgi:hypothetical protein